MTNCRKLVWSMLQTCVKTMTCQETFYLRSVSKQEVLSCLSFIFLFFYIPNVHVVCPRSCQSDWGSSTKEKWTNSTGESYLHQLLLLATGPGYVGCSAPSQGVLTTLFSIYINRKRIFGIGIKDDLSYQLPISL